MKYIIEKMDLARYSSYEIKTRLTKEENFHALAIKEIGDYAVIRIFRAFPKTLLYVYENQSYLDDGHRHVLPDHLGKRQSMLLKYFYLMLSDMMQSSTQRCILIPALKKYFPQPVFEFLMDKVEGRY